MKTAVISDIHGNLIALEAFFAVTKLLGVDRTVCLGDVVGYNPWPNECIDILRRCGIPTIMGNHDRVAAGIQEPIVFNDIAREAILWTREVLTEKNREYLRTLPSQMTVDKKYLLVHGSAIDPDEYILSPDAAAHNIAVLQESTDVTLCFFGHSHVVSCFLSNGTFYLSQAPPDLSLDADLTYLINPGSIGQPRDGDSMASFLIFDEDEKRVKFHRFRYDIESVVTELSRQGLNPFLGQRLYQGK
ncbi:MAG: metallophosphoesterase family protein [Deltaproteobacteria bacterium]|nr:metallophosphoesterase family protein [Candidatus Zymogenaceae bacterium]